MTKNQAIALSKKLRKSGMNYSQIAKEVCRQGYQVTNGGVHRWINPLKPKKSGVGGSSMIPTGVKDLTNFDIGEALSLVDLIRGSKFSEKKQIKLINMVSSEATL